MNLIFTFLGFFGISLAGVYVIYKGHFKPVNLSYFLMAFSVGLWAFSHWLLQLSFAKSIFDPLFLARLSFFLGSFVSPSYLLFSIIFPAGLKWPGAGKITLIYLPALCVASFSFTNFYVTDIIRMGWGFDWVFNNAGFFLFNIFLLAYIFLGLYVLASKFAVSAGLSRLQLKYMFFSTAITAGFILAFNVLLPFLGYDKLVPFGPSSTIILLSGTAYCLLRYRLLDTEAIVSKALFFLSGIFIVFLFHTGLVYILKPYLGYDLSGLISLGSIFFILFFTTLSTKAKISIDNLVYRQRYDYRQILKDSSRAMSTILDLDSLLNYFADTISKNIGIDNLALFLKEQDGFTYKPSVVVSNGRDAFEKISLYEDSKIIDWLKAARGVFIRQAVQRQMPPDKFNQLYGELAEIRAEVILPLFYKGNLLGVLSLDNKTNSEAYSSQDLEVLETIAQDASIAIENARLYSEVITDTLTGLYHPKYFQLRISEEIERAKRFNHIISLLMIDIDNYKELNETFGHIVGDKALKEVAGLVKAQARSVDIPARYGGDEFVLLMVHGYLSKYMNVEECRKTAYSVADKLRKKVEEIAIAYEGKALRVTVSVGIVSLEPSTQGLDKEKLIQLADMALSRAKEQGRNRIMVV